MLHHNKAIIQAEPLYFSHTVLPEEVFESFAKDNWAMWLDSCESSHIDSRYDIMVWQPEITLTTYGQQTSIHHCARNKTEISDVDPLLLLQKVSDDFFQQFAIKESALPFLSGALGYFAYDLGRRFEALPEKSIKDINIPEMAVGIYSHAIIYDKNSEQYYLICEDKKRAELAKYIQANIQKNTLNEVIDFQLTTPWQANIEKQQYQEKFNKIQQYLLSGDCYQINLTQRFSACYQGNEFHAYKKLRKENKAPFSAFIRLDNCSILSISPERFLQLEGQRVQSKPIKGTIARSVQPNEDSENARHLAQSEKDRAENLMIVDLLRNDISKVCIPGTVTVPELFAIESFPAVHHLVSTVEGKLEEQFDAYDLLRASFPGGSITGAPKIRAMEIIDELEPQRRSIYCGSIGYISACGNMDTSITIRTLVCENTNIHCWAGGGIVADSDVDSEYQESFDKVNKILPIL